MLKISSSRLALIFVIASLGFHSVSPASISQGEAIISEDVTANIDAIDAATRASKCQLPSYVSNEGRQYYFELDLKFSYSDASKHCQKLNMELVSIEDSEENAYLTKLIKEYGPYCFSQAYWTSGYRINNNFYWGTVSPFVYANWQYSEPNDALSNKSCVNVGAYFLQWNDDDCNAKYNFICESANNF